MNTQQQEHQKDSHLCQIPGFTARVPAKAEDHSRSLSLPEKRPNSLPFSRTEPIRKSDSESDNFIKVLLYLVSREKTQLRNFDLFQDWLFENLSLIGTAEVTRRLRFDSLPEFPLWILSQIPLRLLQQMKELKNIQKCFEKAKFEKAFEGLGKAIDCGAVQAER